MSADQSTTTPKVWSLANERQQQQRPTTTNLGQAHPKPGQGKPNVSACTTKLRQKRVPAILERKEMRKRDHTDDPACVRAKYGTEQRAFKSQSPAQQPTLGISTPSKDASTQTRNLRCPSKKQNVPPLLFSPVPLQELHASKGFTFFLSVPCLSCFRTFHTCSA